MLPSGQFKACKVVHMIFFSQRFCFVVFGFIHEPVGGCTQDSIHRFKQFLSSAASFLYSNCFLLSLSWRRWSAAFLLSFTYYRVRLSVKVLPCSFYSTSWGVGEVSFLSTVHRCPIGLCLTSKISATSNGEETRCKFCNRKLFHVSHSFCRLAFFCMNESTFETIETFPLLYFLTVGFYVCLTFWWLLFPCQTSCFVHPLFY